jgi:succinate dehydrogenase / fumarate reductase cytochrome b subunit
VAVKKRPVNLDIGSIKLPITAYVSILHRVSGVITFFALAVLLWLLDQSLASQQSFDSVRAILSHPLAQFIVWGSLVALLYHAIAGIRHLLMDLGVGEDSFKSGRISAWIAVGVALALIALLTGWIYIW